MDRQKIQAAWSAVLIAHHRSGYRAGYHPISSKVIAARDDDLGDVATVFDDGKVSIVVVHGSDDWLDWIMNLDAHADKKTGMIHGFELGYEALVDEVLDEVDGHGRNEVIFSGYSRGSPIAVYMHDEFRRRRPDILSSSIVFASPRHYRRGKGSDDGVTTIVNPLDPVTWLPPFRTRHSGDVVRLGKDSWRTKIARAAMMVASAASKKGAAAALLKRIGVQHKPSVYETLMKRNGVL